eukprot:CAMPEP_0119004508 /NCGR_PEP_ID=MMETSP1176-20130426/1177_1 /TAXON_ID=265551 /ORGANISM="Synedropsis recta cf, Strain CCMP1620" /LENGTH=352 /DNA_ID=CAMNT_0006956217 /DNA_START=296 /DNA_END=1354 /DNA_ORIENTATION=+
MMLAPTAFLAVPTKSRMTAPALQAISDDESSSSDGSSSSNDEPPTMRIKKKSLRQALNLSDNHLPALVSEEQQDCWIVGHRGALYHDLENTLDGFQYCLDVGADAVELDVFLIADHLIVFHGGGTDENPGDLTDYCVGQANRTIADCTSLEEVQSLQFNPNCCEFGCPTSKIRNSPGIPTLQQVLELVKESKMVVKIELKGPGTVRPVLDLVTRMGMQKQCHYSSFDHSRIQLVRELHPELDEHGTHVYRTGALFKTVPEDFIALALAVGATEAHLPYSACTVERIQQIHASGMGSMAWFRGPVGMTQDTTETFHTVGNEDENMYRTVLETGVQQLCCNRPDLLVAMLRKTV